jgi:hypothetical protein
MMSDRFQRNKNVARHASAETETYPWSENCLTRARKRSVALASIWVWSSSKLMQIIEGRI